MDGLSGKHVCFKATCLKFKLKHEKSSMVLPACAQVYLETLADLQDRLPSFPTEIARTGVCCLMARAYMPSGWAAWRAAAGIPAARCLPSFLRAVARVLRATCIPCTRCPPPPVQRLRRSSPQHSLLDTRCALPTQYAAPLQHPPERAVIEELGHPVEAVLAPRCVSLATHALPTQSFNPSAHSD